MAPTYELIASNTLTTSAASVTFSSIPATYTDLVLRVSVRNANAATTGTLRIELNGDTAANYSFTALNGDGSVAASSRSDNRNDISAGLVNAGTSTSNTFSSIEFYFPNYTSTVNKPVSVFTAQENNTTAADIRVIAGLYRNSTAINQIVANSQGANFVSGSSFWLYGIKNS
jgi:hypothetical protein